MLALHLRAEIQSPSRDLRAPDLAPTLWAALRRRLPEVYAAAVLPRRIEVIVPSCDPLLARRAMGQAGAELQRLAGLPSGLWAPPRLPEPIDRVDVLRGRVVGLAAAECRAQLAGDPLEPLWSTHRDVMGACVRGWVDPRRLAGALRLRADRLRPWVGAALGAQPGLSAPACLPPRAAPPTLRPSHNLEDVALAAATAFRRPVGRVQLPGAVQALYVALARHVGWRDATAIAERARIVPAAVPHLDESVGGRALAAGARCLGDPRLLARMRAGLGPREDRRPPGAVAIGQGRRR